MDRIAEIPTLGWILAAFVASVSVFFRICWEAGGPVEGRPDDR